MAVDIPDSQIQFYCISMPELLSKTASIVLVGDFNPSIFQPAWMKDQNLLSRDEDPAPASLIISSEISSFSLPWLSLRVIQHHFNASTTKESHFLTLRDLVAGTFKLLRYTPIRQMGINLECHYRFDSEAKWNDFGHVLAPPGIWSRFMKDPGLEGMNVIDKTNRDNPPGYTRFLIRGAPEFTVLIQANQHLDCQDQPPGADKMVDVLQRYFQSGLRDSQEMIEKLLSAAVT